MAEQTQAKSHELPLGFPWGWQGCQHLSHLPLFFPGTWAGSWLGSRAAGTWTSCHVSCQHCGRQQLYPLSTILATGANALHTILCFTGSMLSFFQGVHEVDWKAGKEWKRGIAFDFISTCQHHCNKLSTHFLVFHISLIELNVSGRQQALLTGLIIASPAPGGPSQPGCWVPAQLGPSSKLPLPIIPTSFLIVFPTSKDTLFLEISMSGKPKSSLIKLNDVSFISQNPSVRGCITFFFFDSQSLRMMIQ